MAETVTLRLADSLAQQAREIAIITQGKLEDMLLKWLGYFDASLSTGFSS